MKRINEFFFPLEEDEGLSAHDAGWFYGILGGAIALTVFVVGVTSW